MAITSLDITTEKAIKDQTKETFNELDFHFSLKPNVPNDITIVAIEEGRKLMANSTAPRCSNMNELKGALKI